MKVITSNKLTSLTFYLVKVVDQLSAPSVEIWVEKILINT